MPREAAAYLLDIVEACDAIKAAIDGLDFNAYGENRVVRSAVEREFFTIGEAAAALRRRAPDVFERITHADQIVDFRNALTHEYMAVNDALVWGIAQRDVETLHHECAEMLWELTQ